MTSGTVTRFHVQGMKCNGCIARARTALGAIAGYEDAQFDLKAGTAEVHGDIDPQAAAQALGAIGYPAVVKSGHD